MMRDRALPATVTALVAALVGSCSDETTIVPVRNLERPADMGFACLAVVGPEGGLFVSGRPMSACHPPNVQDTRVDLTRPRTVGTFGLVTNTARGEVAVVDLDADRLVDLDPQNFGYSQVPVGALPEVISVSTDSCRAVTANRGSCDLSLLDPARILASRFTPAQPYPGAGEPVRRIVPTTASGAPLHASPYDVAFVPPEGGRPQPDAVCAAEGVLDGETLTPWRAIVTFPTCDLVALLELPSGRILDSVRIGPDGPRPVGPNPVCPVECGGGGAAAPLPSDAAPSSQPDGAVELDTGAPSMVVDAAVPADVAADEVSPIPDASSADGFGPEGGADGPADGDLPGDGAGSPPPGSNRPIRVGPLAVVPEGNRVYVGGLDGDFLTALRVSREALGILPDGGRIPLVENPVGVTRMRLSIEPFALTPDGVQGKFVGNRGEFLYAFARDGSVRVVSIGRRRTENKEEECDTNVDPLSLQGQEMQSERPCFPVAVPPEQRTWTRLPLADGPGIRIPVTIGPSVPPPVPRDVAFLQLGRYATGYLLTSSGQTYLLTLSAIPGERDLTHSFRPAPEQGAISMPRLGAEPGRSFASTDVPFPAKVTVTSRFVKPRVEGIPVAGTNVLDYVTFPEPSVITPQDWSIVWEGVLPGSERREGRLSAAAAANGAGALSDVGANFCRAGAQPGDVLALVGCTEDQECSTDGSQTCYRAIPGAPGQCFPKEQVSDDRVLRACRRHLTSRRRYEIREATRTQLTLGLKLDEVPRPSLLPCQTNADCQPDEAHQPNPMIPGDAGFECRVLQPGQPGRCVKRCGVTGADGQTTAEDRACRPGHVCEDVGLGSEIGPLCVEAPPPDPACVSRDLRYRVQAGNGYLVSGSGTPYFASAREAGPNGNGGQCVPNDNRDPRLAQRIPLSAPACTELPGQGNTASAARAMRPSAAAPFGNPCLFLGPNGDDPSDSRVHVKALFENPQVRLVVTNLEEYVGDAASLFFQVVGGFRPLRVSSTDAAVAVNLGVRIVTSPIDAESTSGATGAASEGGLPPYLFIVDQGRTGTFGSRGQVLRLNPRATPSYPGGRLDSQFTRTTYPIQ